VFATKDAITASAKSSTPTIEIPLNAYVLLKFLKISRSQNHIGDNGITVIFLHHSRIARRGGAASVESDYTVFQL
jgi:hypothetical protein